MTCESFMNVRNYVGIYVEAVWQTIESLVEVKVCTSSLSDTQSLRSRPLWMCSACAHTHTHTHTHTYTNTHTNTHKYTQTYTHKHIHTQTHTHTNTYKHKHTRIHTQTHTHIQTHKNTHTQTRTHAHTLSINPQSLPTVYGQRVTYLLAHSLHGAESFLRS
jgi:hypothetical protein